MSLHDLTPDEVKVITEFRKRNEFYRGFYAGVQASMNRVINLAEEGCGGAGIVSETDRVIIESLSKLEPPK
jgi:hypothetical protein